MPPAIDTLRATLPPPPNADFVLAKPSLELLDRLADEFLPDWRALLHARAQDHARFARGELPDFDPTTASIRTGDWRIDPLPTPLLDRRVEITGPVERRMIVNALNSGAQVFMADFEDSTSPTWDNVIQGQRHLHDAIRRQIDFTHPTTHKRYTLDPHPALLMVRPRGLHLLEHHLTHDGQPLPAALVDFALYMALNAQTLVDQGLGPYLYLPKLEHPREAQWWNRVIARTQSLLGLPLGTTKVTVLIETLPAAFAMHEILHALRHHAAGLNCGRWDYIFSTIKTCRADPARVLPDRAQVGMTQPAMQAYTDLLIQTCHRRGAHAMGGMAAQIPIKDDPERNARALAAVAADKRREAQAGHDGTWVAHPALVPIAQDAFADRAPHQHAVTRDDVSVTADDLLRPAQGTRTEAGLRTNLRVGIHYLAAWLRGQGCVPIDHLMEDAATAEISRAQLWQWRRHRAPLDDGRPVTDDLLRRTWAEELATLRNTPHPEPHLQDAADLFLELCLADELPEFLTLPAYDRLTNNP